VEPFVCHAIYRLRERKATEIAKFFRYASIAERAGSSVRDTVLCRQVLSRALSDELGSRAA
jgi:hypothetical protein